MASALALLACPAAVAAPTLPSTCYDPTRPNADYEAYGPTDVSAQTGDGRLTVNENAAGTLTVFKYPNPSYYNQVKYLAVSRDARGVARAQFPNEGSFAGIVYRTRSRRGFSWLRDWRATQSYDSPDTAVPVTVFRSPHRLGLTITDADLVVPGSSTLVREIWIRRARRSPVHSVRLVYFENFNPVATRLTYLPIADWCLSQLSDQSARYDARTHAILDSWHGADQATHRPSSVTVAVAFDRPDTQHQIGGDGYDPAALKNQPEDPYLEVMRRPFALGGAGAASGQTTGAIAQTLRFDRAGRAAARVIITSATSDAAALTQLRVARHDRFRRQLRAVMRYWRRWLRRTLLPRSPDRRVSVLAKRTLITIRLAIDPDSGAIVASSDTQGPYGEDWIRDGSFINQVLDANGYTDLVTRHNLFYASVQTSPTNPSPLRPPGNWAMTSYGDGIDGGPIPYEIDETGLGIWALVSHAQHLAAASQRNYLGRVYPALARAADYLVACTDPATGLQCQANEDDNPTPSESLHGAETTELGLRAAVSAATILGRTVERSAWRGRLQQIDAAIARLYDPATRSYREGNAHGNAYNVSYGDGGWLLWPVALRPYGDPRMKGEADAVRAAMTASLRSAQGEYEGKALLGLAYAWGHPSSAQARVLHGTLDYIARTLTTRTGLLGEAWERLGRRIIAVEDMPHVWEHSLFYLAAIKIDGQRRYRFASGDYISRACAARTAPRAVCAP